jgi:hypothetical protein
LKFVNNQIVKFVSSFQVYDKVRLDGQIRPIVIGNSF